MCACVQGRRFDEEGRLVLDLGDTVKKIKKDFGVDQVLAWHAMTGYWAGVEPEAPEMVVFNPHAVALSAPKGIREVDPEVGPHPPEVLRQKEIIHPAGDWTCARGFRSSLLWSLYERPIQRTSMVCDACRTTL